MTDTLPNLKGLHREVRRANAGVISAKARRDQQRRVFVSALREHRESQDIRLREMARRLECSAAMVSDLELGKRWSEPLIMGYLGELNANKRESNGQAD